RRGPPCAIQGHDAGETRERARLRLARSSDNSDRFQCAIRNSESRSDRPMSVYAIVVRTEENRMVTFKAPLALIGVALTVAFVQRPQPLFGQQPPVLQS